jgi:hypothetical protein
VSDPVPVSDVDEEPDAVCVPVRVPVDCAVAEREGVSVGLLLTVAVIEGVMAPVPVILVVVERDPVELMV